MTEQNLWSMARLGECDDMFCKEQGVVQACRDLQKRCVKELAGLMRYPKKFSRCTTKLSPEDDQTYRKMMELLEELFCENCRNVDCQDGNTIDDEVMEGTKVKLADGSKGKVVAVGEFVKKIKVHCGGAVRAHQSPPKAGPASARAWPGHRWEVKKKEDNHPK